MNISQVLRRVYECSGSSYQSNTYTESSEERVKYMEIPLNGDAFELPIFAFSYGCQALRRHDDQVVVSLIDLGIVSGFKSLQSALNNHLHKKLDNYGLVKICLANLPDPYYVTHGAIFDKNFNPMMMCSWWIEKEGDRYKVIKPILRLSRDVWSGRDDSMKRFLSKKLLESVVTTTVYEPYVNNPISASHSSGFHSVEIVIQNCPFVLKAPSVPSISTTNQKLLEVAINNIDEILYDPVHE